MIVPRSCCFHASNTILRRFGHHAASVRSWGQFPTKNYRVDLVQGMLHLGTVPLTSPPVPFLKPYPYFLETVSVPVIFLLSRTYCWRIDRQIGSSRCWCQKPLIPRVYSRTPSLCTLSCKIWTNKSLKEPTGFLLGALDFLHFLTKNLVVGSLRYPDFWTAPNDKLDRVNMPRPLP